MYQGVIHAHRILYNLLFVRQTRQFEGGIKNIFSRWVHIFFQIAKKLQRDDVRERNRQYCMYWSL